MYDKIFDILTLSFICKQSIIEDMSVKQKGKLVKNGNLYKEKEYSLDNLNIPEQFPIKETTIYKDNSIIVRLQPKQGSNKKYYVSLYMYRTPTISKISSQNKDLKNFLPKSIYELYNKIIKSFKSTFKIESINQGQYSIYDNKNIGKYGILSIKSEITLE